MNENFKPHYVLMVRIPLPPPLINDKYIEVACATNYWELFYVQLNLISGHRMFAEKFPGDWNELNLMKCEICYYFEKTIALSINKIEIRYHNPDEIFYIGRQDVIQFDPFKILQ